MTTIFKTAISSLMLGTGAILCSYNSAAYAATFVNLGHAAGAQCSTAWVNDNAQAVGNCSPPSASANNVPWFSATLAGPQQTLAPLVAGQPCMTLAISNNGWIVGSCANGTNRFFATVWSATAPNNTPTVLTPLPPSLLFPLLRPADVQTAASAQNQYGAVIAQSISASQDSTVVLYTAGSGTPERVSGWGDNCTGIEVNNTLTNGYPDVLMNCPGNTGQPVIKIAKWAAGGYSLTTLALPSGASYCWAAGMNDQSEVAGTCLYPDSNTNVSKTAFWPSPTSAPRTLTLPLNAKNAAKAINNAGHILARRGDDTGIAQDLFWEDTNSSLGVRPIVPLPGSVMTKAVGLGNDDTIALNCQDSNQYPTGCYWTPSGGTQPLAPLPGGLLSALAGIAPAGKFVFGAATSATQTLNAVAAQLP
ncbi:hypothetical protein K7402_13585 [Pseudomonas fluorescens group sp.]|nr:hypothetical protein [Pseudomonas fluorescens group sp.]MBZ6465358.1 hypothetical protein [Pseudomonas fluorescens group sp.]MBZ6468427.1 hypothetical protein [Pseudomonas fluorescens group sp.]